MAAKSHSSLSTNTDSLANTALTPLGLILLCSLFLFISSNQKNPRLWDHPHFQHPNPHKGFPSVSVVKNPPANAGDTGLIPGSGRSHSSILAWEVPWSEEPGGLVHGVARVWYNSFLTEQQTFLIHSFYHSSNPSTALRSFTNTLTLLTFHHS